MDNTDNAGFSSDEVWENISKGFGFFDVVAERVGTETARVEKAKAGGNTTFVTNTAPSDPPERPRQKIGPAGATAIGAAGGVGLMVLLGRPALVGGLVGGLIGWASTGGADRLLED
jgi:hypothetical protein